MDQEDPLLGGGDVDTTRLPGVARPGRRAWHREATPPAQEGAAEEDDEQLKILSINVTVLTRERLSTVLDEAEERGVDIIAFQESRHPAGGFRWANALVKKRA